jgi:hypothetical protein
MGSNTVTILPDFCCGLFNIDGYRILKTISGRRDVVFVKRNYQPFYDWHIVP